MNIVHNVIIWLKQEGLTPAGRELFESGVKTLVSNENVLASQWGTQADTPIRDVTDKSFHYALSLNFDSLEAHNAFQQCSEHDEFVNLCKHLFERVLVYDFKKVC